ncbi:MAG: Serine/threonine protein kinase PrkC, regulator of stationary phase [Myxococcaceae bacterium]|nr:Serine/threonine protein kinase PrkC, regulator of stationary phase [Myxococcaceae bacterium]
MSGGPVSAEAERGDPTLIGRTVSGKYKIEKFLGGGAMGAVYKARFAALEKNVAVKVMHRSIAVDPNFVGRFHREAKAASRLDHPNSMRVIDFGEEPDGLLYIAMEYVEGRDLYRVIHEDWPISNADVGDILMQALAAIAVAHEMGVIHRDLKPENLMMLRAKNDDERDAYVVKVCDFGIAKITEKDDDPKEGGPGGQKLTTQGLVVGTPEYMSPEQARGEKLDARSDIYSIGVILYQLLTGRTPFTGDTPLAVVLKHITEAPAAPSVHYAGVHKGLEAVALKALAKDREQRFQSARAMRNAIREALEGRPAPVDIAAATIEVGAGGGPGTIPTTGKAVGSVPVIANAQTAPGAAIESAPTVAGGITASHLTPLGTAAAALPAKKSRGGLVFGLVAVSALLAGGALGATKYLQDHRGHGTDTVSPPQPVAKVTSATHEPSAAPPGSMNAPPSTTTTTTTTPTTAETTATPAPIDPKGPKHGGPNPRVNGNGKNPVEPPPATAVVVAPPVDPPPPEPPPVVNTPPPVAPPPVVPPPPPAPVFNAQTCRATQGQVHANGSTNAKDLQPGNAVATVTSCARTLLREKPAGPIIATVQVRFSDSGQFRGSSCTTCPPALSACVGGAGRAMSVKFRSGDVTGEPSYDVPMTITCD